MKKEIKKNIQEIKRLLEIEDNLQEEELLTVDELVEKIKELPKEENDKSLASFGFKFGASIKNSGLSERELLNKAGKSETDEPFLQCGIYIYDAIRNGDIVFNRIKDNSYIINNSLEDEINRRWNEKDFNYKEKIDEVYKNFSTEFGKDKLTKMSDEECLNKLFGLKEEKGLFYQLQYNYGYFSGVGTLYGGSQRKIFKDTKTQKWYMRVDGTKNINETNVSTAINESKKYRDKYVELFTKIENLINSNRLSTKEDYEELSNDISINYKDFYNSNWSHKYLHMLFPEYFMPFYNDWWINTTFSVLGEDSREHYFLLCQKFCSLAKKLGIKVIYLYHILIAIKGIENVEEGIKINLKERYRDWLKTQVKTDGSLYSKRYINNLVGGIDSYYSAFHKIEGIDNLYEIENFKTFIDAYNEIINYPGFEKFDKNKAANNTYSATLNLYKRFLNDHFGYGKNIIYYGIPGCGKSYYVEHKILEYVKEQNKFRTTFYLDYSNNDFVGQIYPTVSKETTDDGKTISKVEYKRNPGPFTKALEQAYRKPNTNVYLVIEEINRGNAAAIFGDLFQLLDRLKEDSKKDERVTGDSEYPINNEFIEGYLKEKGIDIPYGLDKIFIPNNMFIIATMNTSDQNVFPLDTAFKRRWERKRVVTKWENVSESFKKLYVPLTNITWQEFVNDINKEIVSETESGYGLSEDKQLGAYFATENMLTDKETNETDDVDEEKLKQFVNNVIDYLFNDVTKFDHKKLFMDQYNNYDDLYDDIINNHNGTFGLKIFAEKDNK